MDNKILLAARFFALLLSVTISSITTGQGNNMKNISSGDSLSLNLIIKIAIETHPAVKVAEEAINNADARINYAKTGYYPEVDMNANFANLGPVTKLTIPNMGSLQLFPENNYSASINYRQIVYDFGRTRQSIEVENENKAIGEQSLELARQKLSLIAVNNFYTLLFLQSAIKIKEEQLAALNEHLDQINKMKETGSATEYQVLSTKVRISAVESQLVDLQTALTAQQAFLNSLLGNDQTFHPVVKNELNAEIPIIPSDSLLPYAMKNRDEVILNQRRTSLAELRYGLQKLQNKPMLSFIATGGAKNGYVPNLEAVKPNYVLGLGLRIPIFDGMKNKYTLAQVQSSITSLSYESDYTKRNVSNDLADAEAYLLAAEKKVTQYDLQLEQALKAYSLAVTSFNSGVITNLDLLDSNTAVSESRLLFLKSRIDYAASIYKLKAALGERIY
jgi:outer membrane protein TolC